MASPERQPHTALIDRLFREPFRFSFFKAVRLIERFGGARKPIGKALSPKEEPVRFSVAPGLHFPPSDVAGLTQDDGDGRAVMEVAFMGLIGPSGVLPHWYNEMAIERVHQKDRSLTAFLDIFHHRLVSLFYLAWKKNRLAENYEPGTVDRTARHLMSLIGMGTKGVAGRMGISEEPLIYCGGLLSRRIPSAAALKAVVEYVAGVAAEIEQFVGQIIYFDPEDRTRLGEANSQLGVSAVCGCYTRENQTKFRVNLGPMDYSGFVRFLPSGRLLGPVFSVIQYMAGIEYEFEVRPYLKRREVPACVLGAELPGPPLLGWSTWVMSPGFIMEDDQFVTFQAPG